MAVACKPLLGAGSDTGLHLGAPSCRPTPTTTPGRRVCASSAHRLAGHTHRALVPGWTGHRLGSLGLPPPAGHLPRPARSDPRGPPDPATRARCHAQEQHGGALPGAVRGRHHPCWRHGDATRTQGDDGPATRTSACFARRGAWLHTPADRATSHAPCSSCPWCRGPHASPRRPCSRWRRPVPHRVVRPRVARCPPRWSRVAWPQGSPLGFSSRALGTQRYASGAGNSGSEERAYAIPRRLQAIVRPPPGSWTLGNGF